MRELLKSQHSCCGLMEVICPCSREELGHLVNFLYEGKNDCTKKIDSFKIVANLYKIFGFSSDHIDNIFIHEKNEMEFSDIDIASESGQNEDLQEPFTIVHGIIDEVLAKIELNELKNG